MNSAILIIVIGIMLIQLINSIAVNAKLDNILKMLSNNDIIEEEETPMDIFRNFDGLYTNKKVKPNDKH